MPGLGKASWALEHKTPYSGLSVYVFFVSVCVLCLHFCLYLCICFCVLLLNDMLFVYISVRICIYVSCLLCFIERWVFVRMVCYMCILHVRMRAVSLRGILIN